MEIWREKLIQNCVIAYKKVWPLEYKAIKDSIIEIKKTRKNKFAADYNLSTGKINSDAIRWTLRIPRKLDNLFKKEWLRVTKEPFIPDIQRLCMQSKEINWFSKKYPEFKIAEKI